MDSAIGNSPYSTAIAYNPASKVDDIEIAATNTLNEVEGLSVTTINEQISKIDAMDTIGEVVDFETNIYPRFERGMQNINAVQSTAFVQGKSNLDATYAAQLASKKMELRQQAVQLLSTRELETAKLHIHASGMVIEAARMAIVAFQEEAAENVKYDKLDTLWDLEVVKYGGNFLGAIQGTAVGQEADRPDTTQRALGGALSGAAMGASVSGGNPLGAAAGGVIGLGMSLF
jgi:hypothetical protein